MIITINDTNIDILKQFIRNKLPPTFRYFGSRDINSVKSHEITLIYLDNDIPVGYGHLDNDGHHIWLGICVLSIGRASCRDKV